MDCLGFGLSLGDGIAIAGLAIGWALLMTVKF